MAQPSILFTRKSRLTREQGKHYFFLANTNNRHRDSKEKKKKPLDADLKKGKKS